jgi:hypothetical protein
MRRERFSCFFSVGAACIVLCLIIQVNAQLDSSERAYPQSKTTVEHALKTMQSAMSGRLPALDGFADAEHPGEHSLDRYQRGYYQANAQVSTTTAGGSVVRIIVKITAWYSDPVGARSGYQLLNSNGRLEADLLDQLGEQLGKTAADNTGESKDSTSGATSVPETKAGTNQIEAYPAPTRNTAATAATTSTSASAFHTDANKTQPAPLTGEMASGAPSQPSGLNLSAVMKQSLAEQERSLQRPSANVTAGKSDSQLQAEADSLQEILKSQAHPKNLVAVKKSGTPVVSTPSLSAKPLFLASAHDEFEMLEFNQDWVHVRISGLSRGWIWRNSLEMPEAIPDTAAHSGPALSLAADIFHVTREETAIFPGDWQPLRNKNVKIISVQKIDEAHQDSGPQDKIEYAKYLLDKSYGEMRSKPQDLAGIVLIFDSSDGGMIAATLATLQQWKSGTMSDAAFWHNCFFDPPETFNSASSSGAQ